MKEIFGQIFLWFCLLVSLGLLFVWFSLLWAFVFTRVPFLSSRKDLALAGLHLSGLKPRETFFDLGSGDGSVIFVCEKNFPGVLPVGFELSLAPFWFARLRGRLLGFSAKFYRADFLQLSWQEADVLYTYLLPSMMAKVEKKFLSECRPGARLVSLVFRLPNLPFWKTIQVDGRDIFVYKKT